MRRWLFLSFKILKHAAGLGANSGSTLRPTSMTSNSISSRCFVIEWWRVGGRVVHPLGGRRSG